jgi:hypothetical protein
MPGSESVFWAGYSDGSVVVWDREREDPAPDFYPNEEIAQKMAAITRESNIAQQQAASAATANGTVPGPMPAHQGTQSVFWTYKAGKNGPATFVPPAAGVGATKPPPGGGGLNPVALYKVSKKAIGAISFSPDGQHVGIASLDGLLKVVDYLNERSVWKSTKAEPGILPRLLYFADFWTPSPLISEAFPR